jgi:hypothetical protein
MHRTVGWGKRIIGRGVRRVRVLSRHAAYPAGHVVIDVQLAGFYLVCAYHVARHHHHRGPDDNQYRLVLEHIYDHFDNQFDLDDGPGCRG